MKTYRKHKCTRQHRTSKTFLACAIPRHHWIRGKGNIALIAWCDAPSISLWTKAEDADASKDFIDAVGCGGRCTGRHDIIQVQGVAA
ncbi:hypothetical protein J2790_004262 [Paenarthrobacter nicotinovorans]|nr:hypothetical protein [Paenarthrobacter nicotinovorans]SCZ65320.1 hypothetical protein SAMN02799638_04151 [Arthrobacter sp. UNCCL28]